jgi:crossover junction endodeoxyribonuclease RuvC
MIILGIDPGTARMGYGVVEILPKKKAKLIKTNVFTTPSDVEQHKRLLMLFRNLNDIVKEYSPDAMVRRGAFVCWSPQARS